MTGLVGHWPLHEWSGRANDLSGNGNHGTVSGATQGVSGVGGMSGYSFDGGNGHEVRIGDVHNLTGPLTMSIWIRSDEDQSHTSANLRVLFGKSDSYTGQPYQILFDGNQGIRASFDSDSDGTFQVIGNINANEWTHVVARFNGQAAELFINGVSQGTSSGSEPLSTNNHDLMIGRASSDPDRDYSGVASDARLYDRALTDSEVQTLYEWGSGDYTDPRLHDGSDPDAVARWTFDGDVTDEWGGNDGTDNTSAGYSNDAIRGQAKSFNGSGDYIDFSSVTGTFSDSITISAWMKPTTISGSNRQWLVEYGNTSDSFMSYLNQNTNNLQFRINSDSGQTTIDSGYAMKENMWHHVVLKYDGSKMDVFINGVVQNSTSHSGNLDIENVQIGADGAQSMDYYEGAIDDVRIYSRALEPHEVHQLYQWGTRGRDMRKDLVMQ